MAIEVFAPLSKIDWRAAQPSQVRNQIHVLPRSGLRLRVDGPEQVTYVLKALYLAARKADIKSLFHRHHKSDVVETVPTFDIVSGRFFRNFDIFIIEDITHDLSELFDSDSWHGNTPSDSGVTSLDTVSWKPLSAATIAKQLGGAGPVSKGK
ncbi:hypothetical protein [Tsuneonella troitsensis]